jgi:hypothetical protein
VISEESYTADSDTDPANELATQTSGRHAARSAVWDLPVLGGDAPAGSPGLVAASFATNDAAPPATTPAPAGTAEPSIPATPEAREYPFDARGYLSYGEAARNGGDPLTQETADPGKVQHDTGEPPHPATVDLTELGLPRRIRQTSLAPELREPQPPESSGEDDGVAGWRSPDETRDAFTALQRGWQRGRAEPATTSDTDGAGSPETGANDGGDPEPPGTSEQEDTP